MRHAKHTFKIGKHASHRRCMMANMLKSLVEHGRIETTVTKAKELRRHADRLITLPKKNTLASRRQAIADLMITYNTLTPKEARAVKKGETSALQHRSSGDRQSFLASFRPVLPRRNGGYTRIIKKTHRVGDNAPTCLIEYLPS